MIRSGCTCRVTYKGSYICRLETWLYGVRQGGLSLRRRLIERTTRQMRGECRKRRDPDYCQRCATSGFCRCEIAANE